MTVVVLCILFCYCILLIGFILSWHSIPYFLYSGNTIEKVKSYVSVIVAARNEAENIAFLLKALELQSFSKTDFEVVVVDDGSDDATREVVSDFSEKSDLQIMVLSVNPNYGIGKKAAIRTGLEYAKGDLIVTTDADCQMGANWLAVIEEFYHSRKLKMVIGPVALHAGNTLFSQMQSIEFASLIGSGAASFKLGIPSMCNGANLAYSKEVFFEVNGFDDTMHLASGDDEFLMHKVVEKYPEKVSFLKNKEAVVKTNSIPDLHRFFNQRIRWASKWSFYRSVKPKLLALFIFVSNLSFLLGILLCIGGKIELVFFILVLSFKVALEFIFLKNISDFCKEYFSKRAFGLLTFIYPWYIVFFGLFSKKKSFFWKDRKVM
jgi:biofilm PGA synthesis N-glycosyltransferase PgaC